MIKLNVLYYFIEHFLEGDKLKSHQVRNRMLDVDVQKMLCCQTFNDYMIYTDITNNNFYTLFFNASVCVYVYQSQFKLQNYNNRYLWSRYLAKNSSQDVKSERCRLVVILRHYLFFL